MITLTAEQREILYAANRDYTVVGPSGEGDVRFLESMGLVDSQRSHQPGYWRVYSTDAGLKWINANGGPGRRPSRLRPRRPGAWTTP